jgi:thymidylate synthase
VDSFLGLPFNIASYALLAHMLAQQADLVPEELIFSGGDCHLYKNHVQQVEEQLTRTPYKRPTLRLRERASIDDYTADDVTIEDYEHHPALSAPIAV